MSYKKTMRKRPTVESLVMNIINRKDKIDLPDRTATTLRNTNKLTAFDDNFEMLEQDLKNRRVSEIAKMNYNTSYAQHLGYIPSSRTIETQTQPSLQTVGMQARPSMWSSSSQATPSLRTIETQAQPLTRITATQTERVIESLESELEKRQKEENERLLKIQKDIEKMLLTKPLLNISEDDDASTIPPSASASAAAASSMLPVGRFNPALDAPISQFELTAISNFPFDDYINEIPGFNPSAGIRNLSDLKKPGTQLQKNEILKLILTERNKFSEGVKIQMARYITLFKNKESLTGKSDQMAKILTPLYKNLYRS